MRNVKYLNIGKRLTAIFLLLVCVIAINVFFYDAFGKQISVINGYSKQQVIESISEYYTNMNVILSTVLEDANVSNLGSLETKEEAYLSEDPSKVVSLFQFMNTLLGKNCYIYIYLEELDLLISADGIISRFTFYDLMGKQYTSDIDEWEAATIKVQDGLDFRMINEGVVCTLNYRYSGTKGKLTLGVLDDSKDIFLENTDAKWINTSNVYVFDRYGVLTLTHENFGIAFDSDTPSYREMEYLNEEYDVVCQTVAVGDRQYTIFWIFEKGLDMAQITQLQILLAVVMLTSVSLFFYFIYMQIVDKYRPFKELAQILKLDAEKFDFKLLHNPIKRIITDNENLNRQVEDKSIMLNALGVEKLISGNLNGSSREELEKLGLHFEHNGFVVMMIYSYNEVDASDEAKEEIIDIIKRGINHNFENKESSVALVSMQEYVICILNADIDFFDMNKLRSRCESIIESVELVSDSVVSIVVSDVCNELWQIAIAYLNVLEVIGKSDLHKNSRVMLCRDSELTGAPYGFGMNMETELMFALKNGDYQAAEKIIGSYTNKDSENSVTYVNRSLDLVHALVRNSSEGLMTRFSKQNLFMALRNIENSEIVRALCCDYAKMVCDEVSTVSKEENLVEQITGLIHERYSDSQFCLETICETLGFSSVHLNNIFKEEYNMTIVMYLGNYRIQKAKEIILERVAIKDVAERVGVSNIRTFNRLFHSITGMTPSEYRNNIRLENH